MHGIIAGRMSDRVLLCMSKLNWYAPSKKCSWRAVVVEEIMNKEIIIAHLYRNICTISICVK